MITNTRISVRDAEPRDAKAVAEMANALARITMERPGEMTPETVVSDLIEGRGLTLIVAEHRRDVVGYALYQVGYETAYAARGTYLSDLYVRDAARRRGVARALMVDLAHRTAADGGRYIWWVATPTSSQAQAFYDGIGAIRDPVHARAVFDDTFDALLEPR